MNKLIYMDINISRYINLKSINLIKIKVILKQRECFNRSFHFKFVDTIMVILHKNILIIFITLNLDH